MALLSVSDESLQAVADAIREKGGTSDQLEFPDGFTEAIANIETGGGGEPVRSNDVNFVDYDGTIIYSYSKEDFLSLTDLPANPNHESEGLISKGWNWSLEDAKTFMSKSEFMDIGQEYETDDETTRIYIHISNVQKQMRLSLSVTNHDGSSFVYWGDGDTDEIKSSTLVHDYANTGDYIIKIKNPTQVVTMGVSSSLFGLDLTTTANKSYRNIVKRIVIGSRIKMSSAPLFRYLSGLESVILSKDMQFNSEVQYAFADAVLLKYIVLPKGFSVSKLLKSYAFSRCFNLRGISYSSDGVDLPPFCFQYCSSLERFSFPDNVVSIPSYVCYYCSSLNRIGISENQQKIGIYAFSQCTSIITIRIQMSVNKLDSNVFNGANQMNEIHFESETPPSIYGANSLPTSCYIYVPSSAVETYKAASGWSNVASRIMAEPE